MPSSLPATAGITLGVTLCRCLRVKLGVLVVPAGAWVCEQPVQSPGLALEPGPAPGHWQQLCPALSCSRGHWKLAATSSPGSLAVAPFGAGLKGAQLIPAQLSRLMLLFLLGLTEGQSTSFSLGQCQQLPGGQSPGSSLPSLVLKPLSPWPPICPIPAGLASPGEGPFPTSSPCLGAESLFSTTC